MAYPLYINNLPLHDINFVGRKVFLDKLHELLLSEDNLLIVSGVGGIGKTAVVKEFCNIYKSDFEHFVWINAKNGILENIARDVNLKENMGIENSYTTTSDIVNRIVYKLNEIEGNNLLILDDIDDDFYQFRKLIPIHDNWKILATSRLNFTEFNCVQLGALSNAETLDLFYKHYHLQQHDDLVLDLFKPLSQHALTIEMFAKAAQFHKLPLTDLLKRAGLHGFTFGNKLNINLEHSSTVVENLEKYYDKIFPIEKNPADEIKILRQFVVLPSDYISINDLFKLFLIDTKLEDAFSFGINRLVQKGWLENSGDKYHLSQIIKKFVVYKYPVDFNFYLPQILNLIKLLSIDPSRDNPVLALKWMTFGQELLNYFELTFDEMVALANNLALRYRDNGNFETAKILLEKVLESDLKKYGDDNKIVELSRANLGNLYSDLGNYQKASELLELSLQSSLKNYPENHPKVATRKSNLGLVYRDMGKFEEAARLLKEALDADLQNYPVDDPNVAIRQSNLSLVYKDLGEYKLSRDLLEASIATAIKHYGEKHPRLALRYSNLALVYKAMGEYRRAIDFLNKALDSDLENFGENHPKVAVRLMNIAVIYLEINELVQAFESINRSLKIALSTLGANHPDTIAIKKMYDTIIGLKR